LRENQKQKHHLARQVDFSIIAPSGFTTTRRVSVSTSSSISERGVRKRLEHRQDALL
jgi:hypothetical protein